MAKQKLGPIEANYSPQALALWNQYVSEYELSASDEVLLREACATVSLVEALDVVADQGPMLADKIHPAVTEARFAKALVLKQLSQLERLADVVGNSRNKGGSRGAYGVRAIG
jgi:NAD-specific glutamate dehydrogenase